MDTIDWGLVGVFFFSLVIIVTMLVRKRTHLVVINLETIAAEREARVREQLLRDRIRRACARIMRFAVIHNFAHRIDRLAHRLETDARTVQSQKEGVRTSSEYIVVAEEAMKRGAYEIAEEQLLLALRHDPHNARAYHRLGTMKVATRATKEAIDALSFAVQLQEKERSLGFLVEGEETHVEQRGSRGGDTELAETHMDLGSLLCEAGEPENACTHFEDAAVLVPGNPRYLDALVTTAILLKNRKKAEEALEQLRAVNPENEKIASLAKQIAELESLRKRKKVVPL